MRSLSQCVGLLIALNERSVPESQFFLGVWDDVPTTQNQQAGDQ